MLYCILKVGLQILTGMLLQMSSITKSGRVIHKPQLMDIFDEDKRQRMHREQMKQSKALLNTSLDEVWYEKMS